MKHRIEIIPGSKPPKCNPYPVHDPFKREIMYNMLKKLEEHKVIRKAYCLFMAPIHVVYENQRGGEEETPSLI